jgi:hypothetical protein
MQFTPNVEEPLTSEMQFSEIVTTDGAICQVPTQTPPPTPTPSPKTSKVLNRSSIIGFNVFLMILCYLIHLL